MTHSVRAGRRRTLTRSGKFKSEGTAACPVRDRTVPLEDCVVCTACESIVARGDVTYIQCDAPAGHVPRSVEPARHRRVPSDADRTAVRDVMSRDVLCVTADVPIQALIHLLVERRVSGVPVVDGDGHPVGVVSKTDIAQLDDGEAQGRVVGNIRVVGDIMMPIAFTVVESASLSQCAALMAYEGVHRIPVVSVTGQVIGIISALDVARWLARRDGYILPDAGSDEPPDRPHP